MVRGRKILEAYKRPGQKRKFNLGMLGYPINLFAVIFNIFTAVFFFFPSAVPVTSGTDMNWVVVVIAVIAIFSALSWVCQCRKSFQGPTTIHPEIVAIATGAQPTKEADLPYPYHDFAEKHMVTNTEHNPSEAGTPDQKSNTGLEA